MNKNRKYLSSAVALTLLATAPVVAPVIATEFEGVVVKAVAVTDNDVVQNNPNPPASAEVMLTNFKSQFGDRYIGSAESLKKTLNGLAAESQNWNYFNPSFPQHLRDLQSETGLKALMNPIIHGKLTDNYFVDTSNGTYYYRDIYGYVSIADASHPNGVDVSKNGSYGTTSDYTLGTYSHDLQDSDLPITVTIHLVPGTESDPGAKYNDYKSPTLEGITDDSLKTFSFKIYLSQFDVTSDNDESVSAESKTTLSTLNDNKKNQLSIVDNFVKQTTNNETIINGMTTPIYGKGLFDSDSDALSYAASDSFDPSSSSENGTDSGALDSDGKLIKPGVYYQLVSYKVHDKSTDGNTDPTKNDTAIKSMFTGTPDILTNTVIDPYTTKINGTLAKQDNNTYLDKYVLNKNTGTITVARKITVTGDTTKNIDEPIKVTAGISSDDKILTDTSKDSLKSEDKSIYDKVTPETNYYNADPIANAEDAEEIPNALNKPGTYYRLITFNIGKRNPDIYNFGEKGTYKIIKDSTDGNKVSFVQEVDVKAPNDATANIDKNVTVTVGTSSKDSVLTDTSKDTLVDGKTTLLTDPTPGEVYYDKDPSKDTKDSKATEVSNALNIPGTYYRKLTFNLTGDVSTDKYNFVDGDVSSDGKTVTYYQPITVKAKSSSNSGSSSHDHNWTISYPTGTAKTKNDQSTYPIVNDDDKIIDGKDIPKDTILNVDRARTDSNGNIQYHIADGEWINANYVTFTADNGTDSDWTYYKDPGYVVTFDKQDFYMLNNQANGIIGNRALAQKSAWITDQYRTNKAGVKQYRVATGEWIDSHDVIFVKAAKRIVNVDATKSYYNLYSIEEHLVNNRALNKKTSWYTDATAEDADGNVYYRVSTNEWVKQVDGVHLDTSAWYK